MLNILVIHGYVQTADTVAYNTRPLAEALADVATLNYIDGPVAKGGGSARPWWILEDSLELKNDDRWSIVVDWWAEHLGKNKYDGVIGLSQGGALIPLLLSMIFHPEKAEGKFDNILPQPIKFAIMSSGFVSHRSPHKEIYAFPENIPSLITVDDNDSIVSASRTIELSSLCKNSTIQKHNEGHRIPVLGDWPKRMKEFILSHSN